MFVTRHEVSVTTGSGGGGAATEYTGVANGYVLGIQYVPTDFAGTPDLTVTSEHSSVAIMTSVDIGTATALFIPETLIRKSEDGTADTPRALVPVADERIKLVIDNAGATKTATFHVFVGG